MNVRSQLEALSKSSHTRVAGKFWVPRALGSLQIGLEQLCALATNFAILVPAEEHAGKPLAFSEQLFADMVGIDVRLAVSCKLRPLQVQSLGGHKSRHLHRLLGFKAKPAETFAVTCDPLVQDTRESLSSS